MASVAYVLSLLGVAVAAFLLGAYFTARETALTIYTRQRPILRVIFQALHNLETAYRHEYGDSSDAATYASVTVLGWAQRVRELASDLIPSRKEPEPPYK